MPKTKHSLKKDNLITLIIIRLLYYLKYAIRVPMVLFCGYLVIQLILLFGILLIYLMNFILGNNQELFSGLANTAVRLSNVKDFQLQAKWQFDLQVDNARLLGIYGLLSLIVGIIGEILKKIFKFKFQPSLKNRLMFVGAGITLGYLCIFLFFIPLVNQGLNGQQSNFVYFIYAFFFIFTVLVSAVSMVLNEIIDYIIKLLEE